MGTGPLDVSTLQLTAATIDDCTSHRHLVLGAQISDS